MSNIGSYVMSGTSAQFGTAEAIDVATASVRVLKLLGNDPARALPYVGILGATRIPEAVLRHAIAELSRRKLIEGDDAKWSLTPLGYKAQFVVAA